MKVIRYFQSCLLIEEKGVRILIDPSGQEKERLVDFGKLDAVLYTHEHSDHFDAGLAQIFIKQVQAAVYANASTAKQIGAPITEVRDGQQFTINGLKIKVIELPHCLMVDGREGPQNSGYVINEQFFHPGDGKELGGLSVDTLAVPISGPDISLKDAYDFTIQVGAKQVIPIHYDYLGGNPDFLGASLNKKSIKVHSLTIGDSAVL
jgi:L-ascorbate metabolism protein UlaG (beta-lactamase superfamily)